MHHSQPTKTAAVGSCLCPMHVLLVSAHGLHCCPTCGCSRCCCIWLLTLFIPTCAPPWYPQPRQAGGVCTGSSCVGTQLQPHTSPCTCKMACISARSCTALQVLSDRVACQGNQTAGPHCKAHTIVSCCCCVLDLLGQSFHKAGSCPA